MASARAQPAAVLVRPGAGGGYRHPPAAVQLVAREVARHGGPPVDLTASYALCRRLNAAHGRTYFLATRFLPRGKRRHVHALYAFARYADDLVDHAGLDWSPAERRRALRAWVERVRSALETGRSRDPLLAAVVDTVETFRIRHADLHAFLRSMEMDLEVARYRTYAELREYVHGSAAVIGGMTLPILGARHPAARARAMDLGVAFQLTNFLRDVAEDWDRGRIYLPLEDLDRFGVTEQDFRQRRVGPAMRRLLSFQAARTRELYARAEAGWDMLEPRSRACVRIAHRLYREILDRLEASDWQVFDSRAAVPRRRKLAVAVREVAVPTRTATRRGDVLRGGRR